MKLLIDIPDEVYKRLFTMKPMDLADNIAIDMAIKHGTLLPENFSLEDYERYKKDSENLSWIKCPERMGN